MKTTLLVAATLAALTSTTAHAAVSVATTPGAAVYVGPTPTYDFESAVPISGGLTTTGSVNGIRAQPFGSTGNYHTVGPADGSPATLDLSSFDTITSISLLWGSVDQYNTLDLLDAASNVIMSYTGAAVSALANGDQSLPSTNPLVTFTFTGATQNTVDALRFTSTGNAFEIDNITINAVPEPATWAMMIGGFGLVGSAMRRRRPMLALA